MKFRMAIAAIAVALGIGAAAASADAATINVDLDATNPVNDQSVFLGAGIWTVQPTTGGTFGSAWHPWGPDRFHTVGDPPGKLASGDGNYGWVNLWSFSLDGGSTFGTIGSGFVYATEAGALADAPYYAFVVPSGRNVIFKLIDMPYHDNVGGMRLAIDLYEKWDDPSPRVPAPAAGGLALLGLAAAIRRKRSA